MTATDQETTAKEDLVKFAVSDDEDSWVGIHETEGVSKSHAPHSAEDGDLAQQSIARTKSSVILCGVCGIALGGIFVGAIAAGSAAYLSTKQNAAGDAVRAAGDVGLTVGDKAKQMDSKHHVVQKTRELLSIAGKQVRLFDQKYGVYEKAMNAINPCLEQAKDFDRRTGIVAKVTQTKNNIERGLRERQERRNDEAVLYRSLSTVDADE